MYEARQNKESVFHTISFPKYKKTHKNIKSIIEFKKSNFIYGNIIQRQISKKILKEIEANQKLLSNVLCDVDNCRAIIISFLNNYGIVNPKEDDIEEIKTYICTNFTLEEGEEEETEEEEEEEEEDIACTNGLESKNLYKTCPINEIPDKNNFFGFFSSSREYALEFSFKTKMPNVHLICLTLKKRLGEVLVELIKGYDAFPQNAGVIGTKLLKKCNINNKKELKKQVKSKRKSFNEEINKGLMKVAIPDEANHNRNNPYNAVVIKLEGGIVNVEITPRIIVLSDNTIIQHPIDEYITDITIAEI